MLDLGLWKRPRMNDELLFTASPYVLLLTVLMSRVIIPINQNYEINWL